MNKQELMVKTNNNGLTSYSFICRQKLNFCKDVLDNIGQIWYYGK